MFGSNKQINNQDGNVYQKIVDRREAQINGIVKKEEHNFIACAGAFGSV